MKKFYHIKMYEGHGAVPMMGEYDNNEHKKEGTITGLYCDGEPMERYHYYKGEWAATRRGAISLGNKKLMKKIKYHENCIKELSHKINNPL